MPEVHALFQNSKEFARHFHLLRQARRIRKFALRSRGLKRRALTPKEHQIVLSITGVRCARARGVRLATVDTSKAGRKG